LEQRPDEGLVHRTDDGAQLRMPALESGQRIGDLAPIGPGFPGPALPLHDGDEVDEPSAGDEVVDEVAARAQPAIRRDLEAEILQALGRNQAAISDASGEARALRTEQRGAYRGMNAVGADQDVRRGSRAVGEAQLDTVALIGEA